MTRYSKYIYYKYNIPFNTYYQNNTNSWFNFITNICEYLYNPHYNIHILDLEPIIH